MKRMKMQGRTVNKNGRIERSTSNDKIFLQLILYS